MSGSHSKIGVRYFDLSAAAIAIVVGGQPWLSAAGRAGAGWRLALVVAPAVVYAALRLLTPARAMGWLVTLFAPLLLVALVSAFWPAPLISFVLGMTVGLAALMVGVVAPDKPIREPVTRFDIFKLAALAGSILLALVTAEMVLRLMPGIFSKETQQWLSETPGNSGIPQPYIGYLHRPSRTFELVGKDFDVRPSVDQLGFRNSWPWPRPDMIAVGDSLTFGYGVTDDQAWPALVAHATGKQVLNLGLVGAGPEQYFRLYESFGAKLDPKLVVVGFYAQNDFWDAGLFDQWLREGVGDNYMVWRNFGRPLRYDISLRHPLVTANGFFRARVYQLLRSVYLYNLLRASRGGDGDLRGVKTLTFPDGGRIDLDPRGFLDQIAGANAGSREFGLVLSGLERIRALATERGARTLVVLQPGKEEVYLPVSGEPVPDSTAALRQALDAAGIAYLDLAPIFRERARAGQRLFFEVDSHPNRAGYALIADAVSAYIHRNRLAQ